MNSYHFTPLEIESKEFRLAFRGYRKDEVRNFLQAVAGEWEALLREHRALKEKVAVLEAECKRLHELESLLKDTLLVAQSAAEEARASARREAQAILQEAETQRIRLIGQIEHLKAERNAFIAQLRSFLESFYEKIIALTTPEEPKSHAVASLQDETPRPSLQDNVQTETA
jgi:cell division initiation protein